MVTVGSEVWTCFGSEATVVRDLPTEDGTPAMALPEEWYLFGPYPVAAALDPARITAIPGQLALGETTVAGRAVQREGDLFDVGRWLGGCRVGQQAYLMAQVSVPRDLRCTVGVGVEWWMQWWLDGRLVYDSMAASSFASPPSVEDDHFEMALSAGTHLLLVRVVSQARTWLLRAAVLSPPQAARARVRISDEWRFLPDSEEIRPPDRPYWTHHLALRTDLCLADETIECEYQQPWDSGNCGIVFGAQDSAHYYWAQVPNWGQLWRGRAFYAALSVADGSGYLRNLQMRLMPNVPCHLNAWRSLKVERRGDRIEMWVNGVRGPCVTDSRYGAGRVGLAGFSKFRVRHLRSDGRRVPAPAWPAGDPRPQPWYWPVPDLGLGDVQAGAILLRLSADEVLMAITIGRGDSCHTLHAGNSATYLYVTRDGGRTWSPEGIATEAVNGRWWVPEPGRIRMVTFDREFSCRDSTDRGRTWSAPVPGTLLGDWHRDLLREKTWNWLYGFAELADGALLAVILHGYENLYAAIPNCGQGTWGTEIAQPYCTLSRDQGRTWSEPVPMDNAALDEGGPPDSPCGGFSETAVAELPGGRIVALARPYRAPFMWQTHSDDGGHRWRMACYAPFSGAGGPALVATRSGYLALFTRGPGCGLHVSLDGGVNWDEGTMIDYPSSFNGSAVEVEPDVVLVVYPQSMDEVRPTRVRAQRIRITPEGPVPLGR
ncbi:MAG: sialidase family protein [Candidatus Latescibacterota bacterium]